uniref:Uncharacterized protein n=1 Tax=Rhizophora mucronata TaxID=61149 RepID=A0A2P2QL80_RHIMU
MRFGSGTSRAELKNELCSLAVQMITSFRSYYFLDALLRMLLEPVLPLISLLKFDNEAFLREILYEAVITMDWSFLNHERELQLSGGHLKNLAVTWLFIANNAVQSVRETGDEMKVTRYVQAFSESCLPPLLIKWAVNQLDMQMQISTPNGFTPVTLISEFLCYFSILLYKSFTAVLAHVAVLCLVVILSKHVTCRAVYLVFVKVEH